MEINKNDIVIIEQNGKAQFIVEAATEKAFMLHGMWVPKSQVQFIKHEDIPAGLSIIAGKNITASIIRMSSWFFDKFDEFQNRGSSWAC